MNQSVEYYETFRPELVQYGLRFDQNLETAEDLFELCHPVVCTSLAKKQLCHCDPLEKQSQEVRDSVTTFAMTDSGPGIEYLKLMKTSMQNRFVSQIRRQKWLIDHAQKVPLGPPAPLPLPEQVCRREEMELLMLSMASLSQKDRDILLEVTEKAEIPSFERYRAKKKLGLRLIEVIALDRDSPERPTCQTCGSRSLYFMLDKLKWVCERCGQITQTPVPNHKKGNKRR